MLMIDSFFELPKLSFNVEKVVMSVTKDLHTYTVCCIIVEPLTIVVGRERCDVTVTNP